MVTTYRAIAWLICLLVAVQAGMHAWGSAGMGLWVQNGGVLDKAAMEGEPPFPEVMGLIVHGINGMMVIPAVAVLLLLVSFFAKFPRAVLWAVGVAALVALQVTLGLYGHGAPVLGLLHGMNALLLFVVAYAAGVKARRTLVADPVRQQATVQQ